VVVSSPFFSQAVAVNSLVVVCLVRRVDWISCDFNESGGIESGCENGAGSEGKSEGALRTVARKLASNDALQKGHNCGEENECVHNFWLPVPFGRGHIRYCVALQGLCRMTAGVCRAVRAAKLRAVQM